MNNSAKYSLLGIKVEPAEKKTILENILKYAQSRRQFVHVVSLNPEIIMEGRRNSSFKRAIETAQINIIDGSGVLLALQSIYHRHFDHVAGVDLMQSVLESACEMGLTIGLIGASGSLAEEIASCYQEKYPKAVVFGTPGFELISSPKSTETTALFSIITAQKPHILFFAFGSPAQELWIDEHQTELEGVVCMGVGGAFDFLSGRVMRAPGWLRAMHLEWAYRLMQQPWRVRRQLKLISFSWLVLLQLFSGRTNEV